MDIKKPLLGLSLAFLLGVVPSAPAAPTSGTVRSGPVRGSWDAATPARPGQMRGKLFDGGGNPVISIRGMVVRRMPFFPAGMLVGRARVEAGPLAGTTLVMRGLWIGNARGQGTFTAVLGTPPTSGGSQAVQVRLNGRFRDDSTPGPGGFRGRWKKIR